ncbi:MULTISPECIES: hypothetical protein [unclassified Janthinobacterium]|uniref:hypothetical protein n=1 Tax=unclassified Janthinobacterium TaxID=2610881 RepID=UPI0012FCFC88|nr:MULTISPECIES: hypothetical protein [unclassified Janthinobacterium]MEC5162798.1 hypothetical protein [Janthinobacterium sp. CG_S6]
MNKVTLNSLFLSFVTLSLSTLGGWLITLKLADTEAGISFLYLSMSVASAIFICQALIFRSAQKKLLSQLIYFGSFGFTMGWLMFSLFIPLFWVNSIGIMSKIVFFSISIIICIANILISLRTLDRKWNTVGAVEFENRFRPADSTVDWDKVVEKMKITPELYLPGVPKSWYPAISILLVVLMFVGMSLRTAYPVFSAFAWGIPFAVTAAFFLQMSGYLFAQACKIRALEKSRSLTLKSTA